MLKARKGSHGEFNQPSGIWSEADIEDLTSAAVLKLCKAPQKYWDQPWIAKAVIVNAIIDEFKRKRKTSDNELSPSSPVFFDSLPGRNGISHAVENAVDGNRALGLLYRLTQGERLVVEFYFGLNGIEAIKERAIAAKLGRTERWVENRLESGLNKLRAEM